VEITYSAWIYAPHLIIGVERQSLRSLELPIGTLRYSSLFLFYRDSVERSSRFPLSALLLMLYDSSLFEIISLRVAFSLRVRLSSRLFFWIFAPVLLMHDFFSRGPVGSPLLLQSPERSVPFSALSSFPF